MPEHFTVLGFDYGRARIGVACGQTASATAAPLRCLPAREGEPDWAALDRLLAEWRPARLVVGLPLGPGGEDTELAEAARRFARRLGERYALPVELHDERHSSTAARDLHRAQRARGLRRRGRKGDLDPIAAALVLESWLRERPAKSPAP
ncbi:MAG: putative pre-16S rRNA nuclease [Gammaproteobacteria bacterium]|nr:MAG: putative pre-16S rRNA nuclease [Gammaproteobacteria bacterium]